MQTITANGAILPALGFGTWELRGDDAYRMVRSALEIGYRHIDTAQMYGNETEVGRALADSGIAREEIFLTTKIWPDRFASGDLQRAAAESLVRLQVEAVDLLLLHWPNPRVPLAETMAALAEVKRSGRAGHIGVSNFPTRLLDQALALCREPLAVNQVEYHPYLSQHAVLEKVRAHGMGLTAYCPLARGTVFRDAVLQGIAADHDRSAGQVALRWLLQQEGVCAIPRTRSAEHAASNFAVFDFELSSAEMAAVHALARPDGRLVEPVGVTPAWD